MPEYNVISNEESSHLQGLQQKGVHIIKAEKERLERKKDNIVSRANNAERMILLNQTYQLKQKQYLILIMIFVVTLAICALIIFMQERLGVKKTTLDMLMIAVVVIGFIFIGCLVVLIDFGWIFMDFYLVSICFLMDFID